MHVHNPDESAEGAPSASLAGDQVHAPEREDPVAAARALLAQEEQARVAACAEEINQVLERYGLRLAVEPAHVSLVPTR